MLLFSYFVLVVGEFCFCFCLHTVTISSNNEIGHFFIFCLPLCRSFTNGQWYCFNDQSVTRVSLITVSYMYFRQTPFIAHKSFIVYATRPFGCYKSTFIDFPISYSFINFGLDSQGLWWGYWAHFWRTWVFKKLLLISVLKVGSFKCNSQLNCRDKESCCQIFHSKCNVWWHLQLHKCVHVDVQTSQFRKKCKILGSMWHAQTHSRTNVQAETAGGVGKKKKRNGQVYV